MQGDKLWACLLDVLASALLSCLHEPLCHRSGLGRSWHLAGAYKRNVQQVHLGEYLAAKGTSVVPRDAGDGDLGLWLGQKIIFCRFVSFWPGCHIAARANENAGLTLIVSLLADPF
jgi:hypothetical protein